MSKVIYEVKRTSAAMARDLKGIDPDLYDDVTVGEWEVRVEGESYVDYVGSYRTKKDATEAMRGLKRSKTYKFN